MAVGCSNGGSDKPQVDPDAADRKSSTHLKADKKGGEKKKEYKFND